MHARAQLIYIALHVVSLKQACKCYDLLLSNFRKTHAYNFQYNIHLQAIP